MPPATTGIKATPDGYLYLDPKVYPADFAADVPLAEATFMAHSQVLPAKASFEARVTQPAWKTRKSWALIATDDRAINPDLMRMMAKRAGSTAIEVKSSHAPFLSQPEAGRGADRDGRQGARPMTGRRRRRSATRSTPRSTCGAHLARNATTPAWMPPG